MTITIDIPKAVEDCLHEEATRTGLSLREVVERTIAERFEKPVGKDIITRLVARIGKPGPQIDASREGIYADL
ncbi:MAG: hypothetical protein ACLQVD_10550 [Capsulimonadaceae bacterium]